MFRKVLHSTKGMLSENHRYGFLCYGYSFQFLFKSRGCSCCDPGGAAHRGAHELLVLLSGPAGMQPKQNVCFKRMHTLTCTQA